VIEPRLQRVFNALRDAEVRSLLMGGQACVIYGAAEFSKDIDFVVLANAQNFERVEEAMSNLDAETIAVPPFDPALLELGLAVHFRCRAPGVEGLRVDLMTKLRGVDAFEDLWERRFTVGDGQGAEIALMALEDLVLAKKTQRDKDWPMIQRLMEVRYFQAGADANEEMIRFLLRELRTPELLIDIVRRHPNQAVSLRNVRPLLDLAGRGDISTVERALIEEMLEERELDRRYWEPLKAKLEELRRGR